jgi:heterodisulfide reductase subunit A
LAKARALLSAALARIRVHEDLEARSMTCNADLVVIGGGIAGIEAALLAAQAGRKVTIVEKEISLGGAVIRTDEVAPSMECAPCMLAPRLSDVRDNRNITVITGAEVTDILGFFGNFTVKATRKARYVTAACIGCEACFEPCPVSVPSAFHLGMGNRKAVYTAFPGSVPAAAAIDDSCCLRFKGQACDECVKACAFNAVNFDDKPEALSVSCGAVILAVGHASPVAGALAGFPLGDRVLTMERFERLAASNGPTGGDIRVAGGPVSSVAVVHCAGSLCEGGLDYCSGLCCMTAMKAGELFRKKIPGGKVTHIHDRLVLPFPGAEKLFRRREEEGAVFVKTGRLCDVRISETGGACEVRGADFGAVRADLVVLATGLGPAADGAALAGLIGLDLDERGFFKPDHPLIRPAVTSIPGIFMAGTCMSPCTVGEAVGRGRAAAGEALSLLREGKAIELESMTSHIDGEACAGCKLCIAVCPYKAITFDSVKKISVVNEAICRGCGTCAAACGGKAAHARHFTNRQIVAEIQGVLNG